eukprot:PhF_6_TR7029/c0_g2_i2/m.10534
MDIGGLGIDFEWKTWNYTLSNIFDNELIHEVYRNHPVMVFSSLVIYYTHLLNVPMDTLVQDILPYARNEYFLPQITISLRMQHKRDREHLTLQVSNTFTGRDIKRIAVQHSEKGPHDVAAIIDSKRLRVFAMGKRKYTFSQMAELYDDETIEELSCVPSVDALQFY